MKLAAFTAQRDDFMLFCDAKGLARKTLLSYEQTLTLFGKYLNEVWEVNDAKKVTTEMVRRYITHLQERGKYTVASCDRSWETNHPDKRMDYGKKISSITINNYIRNIKVFFNFLKDNDYIRLNPCEKVKQLKVQRKAKEFIEDEQFVQLLKHMDTSKFPEYRDYIIIQFLFDTGMRLGECLSIQVRDLDINHRAIILLAENTKGKKDRYVYFSSDMQRELRRWIQHKDRYHDNDILFCTTKGGALTVSIFGKNFKKYCQRIGLNTAHPHQLRNNFANRFLMAGGDLFTLSKILGHSSVTVTEQAYLDLTNEDIRQNYQKFSPLSNLKNTR